MSKFILVAFVLLLLALPSPAQTNAPSSVTLAWNPSPGTNVITNYSVYYGVASRTYTNSVSARTNLTATVTNLVRGSIYFFAATAKDTNGLESDYSSEVLWFSPAPPPPPTILRVVTGN